MVSWPDSVVKISPAPKDRAATAQAIQVLESMFHGLESGNFRSTRIGDPLLPAFTAFVRSSKSAAAAWHGLSNAATCHWKRMDKVSEFALKTQFSKVNRLIETATSVSPADRKVLLAELDQYSVSLSRVMDEEAAAAAKAKGARARPRTAGADIADINQRTAEALLDMQRKLGAGAAQQNAALVQRAFMGRMRQLETAGMALSGTDRILLTAHKKFSDAVGSSRQAEWTRVWSFLGGTGKGAPTPGAIKAEIREFDRLAEGFAKSPDPDTQINLFKAMEAQKKSSIHSRLKGKILGEMFAQHWDDWKFHIDAYEDLAKDAARALGPEWSVLKVYGDLRLGSKEYLDQAILLVKERLASERASSVPLAKLFLGVQVKVESVNSSLEQTLNDIVREAASSALEIERADGPNTLFRLIPSLPGETAHRWVLNAAESDFPDSELKRLIESRVTLHQNTMPMTLEEFNLLAHALMRAAADVL
ncbi:hypothetical protein SAMN05216350_11923 [Polaromonas sp. YR568]|uniref:hypothetical protein n=1 Tax=Polaromonas sp. YR568 TaxID=1855301 RepID=UPI0008EC7A34|nr:hypothetical protein [Polaromonas sp. YR568]SFV04202.1 hypothetical protein SAMN05216350_11923 [Polaromonas sp. YR568]